MRPQEALRFPARCAQLCEKHCKALRDFTGEGGETLALDVGCAVGGAAFELARVFDNVLGIDYSQAFVDAAKVWAILGQCHVLHYNRVSGVHTLIQMLHCFLAVMTSSIYIFRRCGNRGAASTQRWWRVRSPGPTSRACPPTSTGQGHDSYR